VTSLRPNLVKRVARLPKPANVADALQPLFEAISNAIHSTQARFKEAVATEGRVIVTVQTDGKKEAISAIVEDNGPGLDYRNWEAFMTTDTDNKIEIGGKGVGRLMWLDCFSDIRVDSSFVDGAGMKRRTFNFVLDTQDQIQNEALEDGARSDPLLSGRAEGHSTSSAGQALRTRPPPRSSRVPSSAFSPARRLSSRACRSRCRSRLAPSRASTLW
jgi:hypothetical protein